MWILHLRKKNTMCVLWTLWAIVVWIPSIHIGFCDRNVGIAIEEGNPMRVLWTLWVIIVWILLIHIGFFWPQCKYCIWRGTFYILLCVLWTLCKYCSLYTFNLVTNKHQECEYCIFCIGGELCLWRYCGVILLHMYSGN